MNMFQRTLRRVSPDFSPLISMTIITLLAMSLIGPVFRSGHVSAQSDSDYVPIPEDGISEAGDYAGIIISDELEREFLVHVPSGYDPETAVPVVITFHGFGDTAERHAARSEFIGLSDEEGFIVVVPQGRGANATWRVSAAANRRSRSDTQFVRDLIVYMQDLVNVDADRIYVTGFSMGGGLTQRLGCDLSDVVAAIGPVAGAYQPDDECEPVQTVPIITLHGLVDNTVPFNGGANRPNVGELYEAWADWNECSTIPSEEALEDGVNSISWTDCKNDATVMIVTYDDLGHVFPEGGAALIWEFFEEHSRADIGDDEADDVSDEDEEDLSGGVG